MEGKQSKQATPPLRYEFYNGKNLDFEEAMDEEANILTLKRISAGLYRFIRTLTDQRDALEAIVAHHLHLDRASCKVAADSEWRVGGFNVAIPVSTGDGESVIIRCPNPEMLAEATIPGSVCEKMSCEAASYIWMQQNCPSVPIPRLYGFGFPGGTHYTQAEEPASKPYVRTNCAHALPWGYMVLEYIKPSQGISLFSMENELPSDKVKRRNLYRSISKVWLAVARIPQPEIGCYRFHEEDGTISLSNRPVSADIKVLENRGSPQTIPVGETYRTTDQYMSDLLTFHERHFFHEPNAALDEEDCRQQMGTAAFLRATGHLFVDQSRRKGPFILQFTDFHTANIFVDKDWNLTAVIDLEWIASGPADMLRPPVWLTNEAVEDLTGSASQYKTYHNEFMDIFEQEERLADMDLLHKALGGKTLTSIMWDSWDTGRVWFYLSCTSISLLYHLTTDNILPIFGVPALTSTDYFMSLLWSPDVEEKVAKKLKDRDEYLRQLAALYEVADIPDALQMSSGRSPVLELEQILEKMRLSMKKDE